MLVVWAIAGVLAAAATLSLLLWMRSASDPLRLAEGYLPCRVFGQAGGPLVCLHLARTRARTAELLTVWLSHAALLDRLLRIDFLFMVAYAVFGVTASVAVGAWLSALGLAVAATVGTACAILTLIAAALDAIETTALLIQLRTIARSTHALLAYLCALGKFGLLALVGAWLVAGTIVATFAMIASVLGGLA
jgi:hypothetical protein